MHCISKVKLMKLQVPKKLCRRISLYCFSGRLYWLHGEIHGGKLAHIGQALPAMIINLRAHVCLVKKSQGLDKNLGREIDISRENKNLSFISEDFLVKLSCE